MSNAIEFRVKLTRGADNAVTEAAVYEESGRLCSRWPSEAKGKAAMLFALKEHANGRVAQGTCGKGHASDFDRIHVDLRDFRMDASVVLCDEHKRTVATAKSKPKPEARP